MKNIILYIVILFSVFGLTSSVSASTLSCFQVDGMAIFGYDGSEWVHIGAIGNEYSSLSIANEYGAGNEYKSTSIFNEYGKYGGEYSSYSAFNDYASKPPIIVNDDYEFVGYLTINEYKTPNINTYEAIACAKKSYASPERDMQDVTFKNIPDRASSYGSYSEGTTYTPPSSTPTSSISCPLNSYNNNGQCFCNSGYIPSGSVCILDTSNNPYQNIRELKIFKNVRQQIEFNPNLSCNQLSLVDEELAMCVAYSGDNNKSRWISIDKPEPKIVTTKSLMEEKKVQELLQKQTIEANKLEIKTLSSQTETKKSESIKNKLVVEKEVKMYEPNASTTEVEILDQIILTSTTSPTSTEHGLVKSSFISRIGTWFKSLFGR